MGALLTYGEHTIIPGERSLLEKVISIAKSSEARIFPFLFPIALTAFALALRLIALNAKDFWADEAASAMIAQLPWRDFWHLLAHTEANMSLYYLLLKLWIHLGDGPEIIRVLSVIFGAAAVPVTYFLGRDLFSRTTGIVAALLLSINVFQIEYSQQARGYSLAVLLCTLSCWLFVKLIYEPDRQNSKRLLAIGYASISALAVYTHFFSALVVVAQAISLVFLVGRNRWKVAYVLLYQLLTIALVSPLIVFILRNRNRPMWITAVTGKDLYHLLMYLTGSGFIFALYLVAILLALWFFRGRRASQNIGWRTALLVSWLVTPIAVTLVVSSWKPFFSPRFLLICLPAPQLLAAAGLVAINRIWIRRVVVTVVLIASISGIRSYYMRPGSEDWRGAAAYLQENLGAGDRVLFSNAYCRMVFEYYIRQSMGATNSHIPPAFRLLAGTDFPAAHEVWMVSCADGTALQPRSQNSAGCEESLNVKQLRGIRITELARP